MDKRIKKKWVDALRSGKYKQGQGRLKGVDDTYCCLGVLCKIANIPSNYYMGYLPSVSLDRLGLDSTNPIITKDGRTAAECNDNGMSFKRIANLIERNL